MFRRKLTLGISFVLAALLCLACANNQPPTTNSGNQSRSVSNSSSPKASIPADSNSPGSTAAASITATPNPVPVGKNFGKTTITWNTGDGTVGQVYVSVGNGPEKLFADERPRGSQDAPWIGAGSIYEFRLYAGKEHQTLLASVKVTRNEK